MQSSLYVTIKSFLGVLESNNVFTLEIVQSGLLVCFYEMGHNIYPAASVSIGTYARMARVIGLNKKKFQNQELLINHAAKARAEEEKRAWWAIINCDRYAKSFSQCMKENDQRKLQ